MSGAMIWLAVGVGIPDLWTRFNGRLVTREARVEIVTQGSSSACPFRVTGDDYNGRYFNYDCLNPAVYAKLQPGAPARVAYRETPFGRHIQAITFRTTDP